MWNELLQHTDHRPYPLPARPWAGLMRWTDLLFAHRSAHARAIRHLVPPGLEIEEFEGRAWVGIVPFQTREAAPRWIPALDPISCFPEVNVRTYVTAGGLPGIWFFSLDTSSRLAVTLARFAFHLPYFHAPITLALQGPVVRFWSERTGPTGKQRSRAPINLPAMSGTRCRERWNTG
jgi:uncharacterized protein